MLDDIKNLSFNDLLSKLYRAVIDFVETVDEAIEADKQITLDEIKQLRSTLINRINERRDVAENEKLLKVLNLFATNAAVLELVRDDADEWLKFIDTIEKRINKDKDVSPEVRDEMEEIKRLTTQIKDTLRRA